jgi:N-methylhydantoinase A
MNGGGATPVGKRQVYFDDDRPFDTPVYQRDMLGPGARIAGPALVQEHGTTTVLFPNDVCEVAMSGELIISVGGAA